MKTKLTFIADTHYFSQSLYTPGRAYELRSDSDQKCLAETGGIIDAAFSYIAKSDTQAVMIIGDLTNDGETVSHKEFREKLYKLKEHKKVYVVTATHDWCCDCNPRRFIGDKVKTDVDTLMPYKLRDFYFDFGPSEALSEHLTNLRLTSYTVDVGENVRLLALNDDQNGKGRSGFTEEHFRWIENEARKAMADGKVPIAMEHHLIVAHTSKLITGGTTCVGDREYVASRLADAGIRYVFVGHSHMQNVESFTSEKGNTVFQINVGSLCGYPAPIVEVTVTDSETQIETKKLESFTFNGKVYDAQRFLRAKACTLIGKVTQSGALGKNEFSDRLAALGIDSKKITKLFFAVKPLLNAFEKARVYDIYRLFAAVGFKKYFDIYAVNDMADVKLCEIVYDILLKALDGTENPVKRDSSIYKNTMAVVNIIKSVVGAERLGDVQQLIDRLLVGGEYNISHCVIAKKD